MENPQVTRLTDIPRVQLAISVFTVGRQFLSTLCVIAIPTQAMRIKLGVLMFALSNLSFLAAFSYCFLLNRDFDFLHCF